MGRGFNWTRECSSKSKETNMSLLGKDFEDAMKQLKATLADAQITVINLNQAVLKLNEIVNKINQTLK